MFLPPAPSLFNIEGHSHQFSKVKNRETHVLPHLQIHLAEAAGGNDTLSPRFLGMDTIFPTSFLTTSL